MDQFKLLWEFCTITAKSIQYYIRTGEYSPEGDTFSNKLFDNDVDIHVMYYPANRTMGITVSITDANERTHIVSHSHYAETFHYSEFDSFILERVILDTFKYREN